jgi:hypothetical protein
LTELIQISGHKSRTNSPSEGSSPQEWFLLLAVSPRAKQESIWHRSREGCHDKNKVVVTLDLIPVEFEVQRRKQLS